MWRKIQKTNFTKLSQLAEFLEIAPSLLGAPTRFPLNLPRRLAEKIEKGNLDDPLLRQFVPLKEESATPLGFVKDPVDDASACVTPKLLQKYKGRALLLSTSACAMHCRYCFRQNFDYAKRDPFEEEIHQIQTDTSLQEVILSGGDPLSLSDRDLESLLKKLGTIEHIKIIRFHTRFPIGIPERITSEFLQILDTPKKQIIFVLHANHPHEFDRDVLEALSQIPHPKLLQSVLLKGVNDDVSILKSLYEKAIQHGIIPYYLHQLDRVEGAAHFEVDPERGTRLINQLRNELPGYAIPTYVSEIAGEPSKTPIL